jgi:hypothetical protein
MKTISNTIYPAFALFALACIAVLPKAHAVNPPPDGGYPGFNTAEGQNALFSRTTGTYNTAAGWFSLRALTGGAFNTAIGAATLLASTRPRVFKPSLTTPATAAITTWLLAIKRSLATQPAAGIQPRVIRRSIATQSATSTRPSVIKLFSVSHPSTPMETAPTRPSVSSRRLALQLAEATLPSEKLRCLVT